MEPSAVHNLYTRLANDRWSFIYSGDFLDEHSARLISMAEEASKSAGSNSQLSKKLAFVMVEAYQNIIRHRNPLPPELATSVGRSLFMVRCDGSSYELNAMNPIRREEIGVVEKQLERIARNGDLKQLKEMFLRGLQGQSISNRGGAGLGLIEMARRSASGLRHDLRSMEPEVPLFLIQMHVGASDMHLTHKEAVHEIHDLVCELDLLLAFKGRSTPGIQNALLRMISADTSAKVETHDTRTKAYLAAMEFINGLDGDGHDTLLLLRRNGDGFSLTTGVLLEEAKLKEMAVQVERLRQGGQPLAQRLYRDALLGRVTGLSTGLIDLARRSLTPLGMEVFPHQDRYLLVLDAHV